MILPGAKEFNSSFNRIKSKQSDFTLKREVLNRKEDNQTATELSLTARLTPSIRGRSKTPMKGS